MEANNGSFGFDFEGVYSDMSPLTTLSYTKGDGRRFTTISNAKGESAKVTTLFDAEKNSTDKQRDGWQAVLNNFNKHVEMSGGN